MNFQELRYLSFNHDKPIEELEGEEAVKEFLFLISGCADQLDPRKHVSLGLPDSLVLRKNQLEQYLIACVNSRMV